MKDRRGESHQDLLWHDQDRGVQAAIIYAAAADMDANGAYVAAGNHILKNTNDNDNDG